jgi:glycosyltransferase involved in cell wall biosynthesis
MLPGAPLRLAVIANFDSPHAWRWVKVFIERGHDVHAISYYKPRVDLAGLTLHVLDHSRDGVSASVAAPRGASLTSHLPPSAARLINALRFRRAGLRELLAGLRPEVLQGHYVVEHGFFAALSGFRPLVVSAWGSDLFQGPRTAAGAAIARYVIKRADLVTGNDGALVREAMRLGAGPEKVAVVRLGLGREFLDAPMVSVNLGQESGPATIISDRALEPLYNVDIVIRAFAMLRNRMPAAQLVVAHDGSQRSRLEALARELGQAASIDFVGRVDADRLKKLLSASHVYVSVPSSDSLSLSTMEAMACGAFPVVTDLASQEWVVHAVNGMRVPARDARGLALALEEALANGDRRRGAALENRRRVEAEGSLERSMGVMERHYYRLSGRPVAEDLL